MRFSCVELYAGGGGRALGLEIAGFDHLALVESDRHSIRTLRHNRPHWNVIEEDLHTWDPKPYEGVDLVSAGLPFARFPKAGRQQGANDDRILISKILEIIRTIRPRGLLIESGRSPVGVAFRNFREQLLGLGYCFWVGVLNPSDFGALQLRRRTVVVALVSFERFEWPAPLFPPIVGDALREMMSDRGSRGANNWKSIANEIAPTLVSGNRNHGGAHLGPTRVGKAWASPGVNDPVRIDAAPPAKFVDMPKLTIPMCAVIQGFPRDWVFSGGKAATYRQVGTAFPPPVAAAVGRCIHAAFRDSPSN